MTGFAACLPCVGGKSAVPAGPVTLNVGGVRYTTSRLTLSGCPKLKELVSSPPGPDGAYFLDRDGRFFSEVLNFLRDGPELFAAPAEVDARRVLQREAAFFELPALAKCVQDVYVGAPTPANERDRMERLEGLDILHTDEHEERYDAITRIIAAILDVPIALISMVADDHQWFKSRVGLDANSTSRNTSFCAYTFTPEGPTCAMMFVIEDATKDSRVSDNPLVTGPPYISFYAGCPLVTSDGIRLGALCAIDRTPRSISPLQAQLLVNFSQICVSEMERTQLTGVDEEDDLDFDTIPLQSDFAAGPLRSELMKESLREPLCLIQVRTDSLEWPVLYANQVWTSFSGWSIIPPNRFPGRAVAEASGVNGNFGRQSSSSRRRMDKEFGLFSWLQLVGKTPTQLIEEIKFNWSQPDPMAFALRGMVTAVRANGSGKERVPVVCRFMPAELPLDAAAAAIRPLPQREAGSPPATLANVPGRLYFVHTVRSPEASAPDAPPRPEPSAPATRTSTPAADRPSGLALTGRQSSEVPSNSSRLSNEGRQVSTDSEARKFRGNTVDAVAAIKPPRSPFEDVRLMRLVGQGSFGKVYYGLWMGSPVAVKTIETRNSQERKFEPAFEAVLSTSMAHPNLVQTFMSSSRAKAAGLAEEAEQTLETWMVQEWCDRGTLGAHCSRPRCDVDSMAEVVDIGIDIACAGSYLHCRGIIHGDLTANNVLIKTQVSRKGYICKICDFGLARVLEGENMDIMTTQLGTVTHMPPELFAVGQEVRLTAMADVYAAGILNWQAVKGEQPFAGLSPPQVVVQIVRGKRLKMPEDAMPEIIEVFERCTTPDPKDRPSFDELVRTFSAILQTLTKGAGMP
mmetsp:Transcript_69347/g.206510  ORF Transcript_69347/g.206510 Transcript_69347/m.206510 type:complete len:856 (+) Transcript_69347:25-2592(+)